MIRKVSASKEMEIVAKQSPNKRVQIYSFFPIDRADCECADLVKEWKLKISNSSGKEKRDMVKEISSLECPRSKVGLNRYRVTCVNCRETLGFCWASDATLKDWCDFHYVSWTDGKQWKGCLIPHISPITEELGLECTCGQDTRDFRANMTLPAKMAFEIEEDNKIGREFGEEDSKFIATKVSKNVIPFIN